MKSIENYTTTYITDDFEIKYQVFYRRKRVLEIMEKYPHQRVLEIGCGMEPLAGWVHDFDEYVIVEPSEKFVEHAKATLDASKKVEIIQGCFEDCLDKLSARNFDFIIISSLLHEVENPEAFMEALTKIVRDESVIHINVPNASSFHRVLALESGLITSLYEKSGKDEIYGHKIVFDMDSLQKFIRNTVRKHGLKEVFLDTGGISIKPFTHRQMEMCLKNDIFDERILDGLYHMVKYMPELASEIYVNLRITKMVE